MVGELGSVGGDDEWWSVLLGEYRSDLCRLRRDIDEEAECG